MRSRGKKVFIAAAAAALAATVIFAGIRLREISAAQHQLAGLERQAEQMLLAGAEAEELRRRFPPQADIASFVEGLSLLAQQAGLRNLEITTLTPAKSAAPARQAAPAAAPAGRMASYPVKLSFEADYRTAAEYLRLVQAMERYKRLVQVELKPHKQTIRISIVIEITAFEASHAA